MKDAHVAGLVLAVWATGMYFLFHVVISQF